MSKHTETPWHVSSEDDSTVVGPKGNVVCECLGYSDRATDPAQQAQGGRESNAKHITHCVNSYELLVCLVMRAVNCRDYNCQIVHSNLNEIKEELESITKRGMK